MIRQWSCFEPDTDKTSRILTRILQNMQANPPQQYKEISSTQYC